jgi:hypothetical protein
LTIWLSVMRNMVGTPWGVWGVGWGGVGWGGVGWGGDRVVWKTKGRRAGLGGACSGPPALQFTRVPACPHPSPTPTLAPVLVYSPSSASLKSATP